MLCITAQGADLLKQARQKYMAKDLMGALKLYEDVLEQVCSLPASGMKDKRSMYSL